VALRIDQLAEGLARQVVCVLEIGAGSALAKMWNERHPDIPARSIDEFGHPQGAAAWIGRHMR